MRKIKATAQFLVKGMGLLKCIFDRAYKLVTWHEAFPRPSLQAPPYPCVDLQLSMNLTSQYQPDIFPVQRQSRQDICTRVKGK